MAAVDDHVDTVTALQLVALKAARRSWSHIDGARIAQSWTEALSPLAAILLATQVRAATGGAEYGAAALAAQGLYVLPLAFVRPQAFAGYAPDGRDLSRLLYSPAVTALRLIGGGLDEKKALKSAGWQLDRIVSTLVADSSRQAAGVDLAARPGVGYVRQLVGKSCPKCVVLAGRFYRWNDGFDRHPNDDCVHVPTTSAASEGKTVDPYAHFEAMSAAEQDDSWGKANAQAVRDGADIYRVANARRGMTKTGIFTAEGVKSGAGQLKPGQRRLTPEGIYKMYPDRAEALQALEQHGYVMPGGQRPGGTVRGSAYEGFGELGRGGTRKAASQAIVQARESGVRDASSRYTMTAAERRLADAQRDWDEVLSGRNPWGSPTFGSTPDPTGRNRATSEAALTPQIAAAVEKNYRRWLATGGQVFGK